MKLQQVREIAERDTLPQVINLADHPVVVERRKQLEELADAERKFQGPCDTCRWREGGEYKVCANPITMKGKQNPVSGEIQWQKPYAANERGTEPYNFAYESEKRVPVCGPSGILWEPRTTEQQRRSSYWQLLWIVLLSCGAIFFLSKMV